MLGLLGVATRVVVQQDVNVVIQSNFALEQFGLAVARVLHL